MCGFTTLRNIHDFMQSENTATSTFYATCIKRRINNVHTKSHKTLISQHSWLFSVFPNFCLGTLF